MTIREQAEKREYEFLCRYAAHSADSLGRDRDEAQDDIRTVYQRDRDRIIHSKSFRRLKHPIHWRFRSCQERCQGRCVSMMI